MHFSILPGLAISFLLLGANAYADEKFDWLERVSNHPNVVVARGNIEAKHWRIKELQAKHGFDIDIITNGDVPIFEQFEVGFSRANESKPYLDIAVKGSYTLYDFGQAQEAINSEISSYEVSKLEYSTAFEKELHSLLTLTLENEKIQGRLIAIKNAIPQLEQIKQQSEMRYESGLGTLTEIRQIQIQLLDLKSQLILLENRLEALLVLAKEQYELNADELLLVLRDIRPVFEINQLASNGIRTSQLSELKVKALLHRQASVEAEAMPVLQGEINLTLYDATRSFNNHELAGQLRLQMPVFDSGYRDARIGSLNHALSNEIEIKHQLLRQQQYQLNDIARQQTDLLSRKQFAQEKLQNELLQLQSLQQTQGKTSNDINGISNLINQIVSTRTEIAGLNADIQINILQKLLVAEQLLNVLALDLSDIY